MPLRPSGTWLMRCGDCGQLHDHVQNLESSFAQMRFERSNAEITAASKAEFKQLAS